LKKIFETNGSPQYAHSEVRNVLLLSNHNKLPLFYDETSLHRISPGHPQYGRRYGVFKKGFQSAFDEIAKKRSSYEKQNAPFLESFTARSILASPARVLKSLAVRWKMSRLNREYDRIDKARSYLRSRTPRAN